MLIIIINFFSSKESLMSITEAGWTVSAKYSSKYSQIVI